MYVYSNTRTDPAYDFTAGGVGLVPGVDVFPRRAGEGGPALSDRRATLELRTLPADPGHTDVVLSLLTVQEAQVVCEDVRAPL